MRANWVYVIELDPDGLGDVGEGAVYVGETGKTPEQRFADHKAGRWAVKIVTTRGIALRPDLYPPDGPYETRDQALKAERLTADTLREMGYLVFGGQGEPFMAHQDP